MSDVIVTFQNKKDTEFITPPMQVPEGFTSEEMEKFLNTLLNQDKTYAFFYNNEQIKSIPKASAEETINIEYLAVTKIMKESAKIEMDSTITSISIRRNDEVHTDSILISTLKGETKEVSLSPGQDVLRTFDSFKPIRALSSTEKNIYVLTATDKIVDVEGSNIIFEEKKPIRSISTAGTLLGVALSSNEIVILEESKEISRIKTDGEIGKIILRKEENEYLLMVAIIEGEIEIYSTDSTGSITNDSWKKKTIKLSRPVTAIGYNEKKIYVGGLGGSITICSLSQIEKEYQSDISFISRIECGSVFFSYTNENRIFIRDKQSFLGTHLIELLNPVTDIKISGKRLFVAEGSSLKLFNIFDE